MNPWNCVFSVNEVLLQVVGVADERLVHALWHPTPDPVVDRVYVRTVSRSQIGGDKLWCLLLQQLNCLASTVHRCGVLLKQVGLRVTGNATHDWQHLLLQQNLAVVSAVHFHPRLDEEQLTAAQFWDSNGHHQRRGERWPTTQQALRRSGAMSRFFALLGAWTQSFCKFTGDVTVNTFSSEKKTKSTASSESSVVLRHGIQHG